MPLKKFYWLIVAGILLLISGVAFSTPKWWRVDSKIGLWELYGLSAIDSARAWAADIGAHVIRSTDGGWNWSVVDSTGDRPFFIDFIDSLRGWGAAGSTTNGWIFSTISSGQYWVVQNDTAGMGLLNLDFVDSLHGVVIGDSGFALLTSDGGSSWRRSDFPIRTSQMAAVCALDTTHLWGGGSSGYNSQPETSVVYFSADWGKTWQSQPLHDTLNYTNVAAVDFLDTLNGFLFSRIGSGSASFLYRTSNGGSTWKRILTLNSDNWGLNDMDATDTLHVWMAGNLYKSGEYAAILSTSDGGNTWDTTLLQPGEWFYKIKMASNHRGWAVGSEGLLYTYAELVRGDLDLDGNFSAADVVLELNKVFLNQPYPALAPAGDVNCDGQFSPVDVVLLLQRAFAGQPFPCAFRDMHPNFS